MSLQQEFSGNIPNPSSPGAWEKHHVIPNQILNDSPGLKDFLRQLSDAGRYDHSDFQSNGIFLPKGMDEAGASGFARHAGSHPAYTEFVTRILGGIENDFRGDKITLEEAAKRVGYFQLYLKDGLVGKIDPTTGTAWPEFLLNGSQDYRREGGAAGQDALRADYNKISYNDVLSSKVFTDAIYREQLKASGIFDPDYHNRFGKELGMLERALLRPGAKEAVQQALQVGSIADLNIDKLSIFDNAAKVTLKSFPFEIALAAIYGVAYAKTAAATDKTLAEIRADADTFIDKILTKETLENSIIGFVVGTVGIYTMTVVAGAAGAVIALGASTTMLIPEARKATGQLKEAFPDSDAIASIDSFFGELEKDLEFAYEIIQQMVHVLTHHFDEVVARAWEELGPDFSFPDIIMAQGDMGIEGDDNAQVMLGTDGSVVNALAGNDYLVHFGSGELDGGEGDDFLLAIAPDYLPEREDPENPGSFLPEELLEIDGGSGDDIIISLGGAGLIVHGGAGNDSIFVWSFAAEVYGDGGDDHFVWAPDILIVDGEAGDSASFFGIPLTGGIA